MKNFISTLFQLQKILSFNKNVLLVTFSKLYNTFRKEKEKEERAKRGQKEESYGIENENHSTYLYQ